MQRGYGVARDSELDVLAGPDQGSLQRLALLGRAGVLQGIPMDGKQALDCREASTHHSNYRGRPFGMHTQPAGLREERVCLVCLHTMCPESCGVGLDLPPAILSMIPMRGVEPGRAQVR